MGRIRRMRQHRRAKRSVRRLLKAGSHTLAELEELCAAEFADTKYAFAWLPVEEAAFRLVRGGFATYDNHHFTQALMKEQR